MDRPRGSVRNAAALAISLVAVACTTAPTASPAPIPTAIVTALPSVPPTDGPTETPTQTVGPSPSAPSVAGAWTFVTGQESASNAQFQDAIWTGRRFVATGIALAGDGGVFASSKDGQRWLSIPSGGTSGRPERLAAKPGEIVAIGTIDDRSAAWHSTDGVHWTYRTRVFPSTLKGDDVVRATDVVGTASGWLAVGRDDPLCQIGCGQDPIRALAWTSSDAESWTRVPSQASLPGAGMNAVTAFDGGFVAVGDGAGRAVIWTSTDGVTWRRVPDDPMFGPPTDAGSGAVVSAVGVAAARGWIVAVGMAYGAGDDGAPVVMAWRSADGRSWTQSSVDGAEGGQTFNVAAMANRFLAVGPSGATSCLGGIWSSEDGAAWACEASADGFAGFGPYAAAGSPSVDVAVGLTEVGWDPDGPGGLPGAIWWRPAQ
jgi:hypothetical protein